MKIDYKKKGESSMIQEINVGHFAQVVAVEMVKSD